MEQSSCLSTEISSSTQLQKELYDDIGDYDPNHPESWLQVRSIFYWEYVRKARAGHTYIRMDRKPISDSYSFETDSRFDCLLTTDLWQVLPEIRVKNKFKDTVQVCWCMNIGLNIVREASLVTETSTIQTMDSIWLNRVTQHMLQIDRDHLFQMIGNVPELTSWSNQLPRYTLTVPQFWDYCRDYGKALPIGLAKKDTISHIYKMRERIASLLRIRIKQGEEWIETRLDACRFKECPLVDVELETRLSPPELYASYSKSNPSEWEWRQTQNNTFYTHDVVKIPGELRYEAGKRFQVPLEIESPCIGIFFSAEPLKALDSNNYSNFTTNPSDLTKGADPFKSVSLMYGGLTKIPEVSSLYSSRVVPARFFPITPYQRGYNVLCIGFAPDGIDTDTTASLKLHNAKLVLELKDIEDQPDDKDEADDLLIKAITEEAKGVRPVYNIHIHLLIYRKISFKDGRCIVDGIGA
jgi:hypothetical protein